MPFAVSQWPYSPDPRGASFDLPGWAFGQVPPWAWVLSTTDATGCYTNYNDGVILKPTSQVPGVTVFENVDVQPDGGGARLTLTGTQEPTGPPPGITKTMFLEVLAFGFQAWTSTLTLLYPTAIQEHGPFVMVNTGTPCGTLPNPMKITPAIWNV